MGDPVQGLQCGFDSLVYATEPHIQDIAGITYTNIGRSYKDLKAFYITHLIFITWRGVNSNV